VAKKSEGDIEPTTLDPFRMFIERRIR